jgi:asparagine synthase (glutamine-hydrolysing)
VPSSPLQELSLQQNLLQYDHNVVTDAVKCGVSLILSGWGGDEFASFNGRGYRADLFLKHHWPELFQSFNWSRFPRGVLTNFLIFWRDIVGVLAPDWFYVRFDKMGRRYSLKPNTTFLLPEFAERVQAASMRAKVVRYQDIGVKPTQIRLYRQGHIPERMERWHLGAGLEGVTYAFPLTDRRLIEFIFQVPDHLFKGEHIGRYLYRKAMSPVFPPDIFDVQSIQPKDDPSMLTHQRMVVSMLRQQDRQIALEKMLRQTDNPWVDVERLKEFAIKQNYQTRYYTPKSHAYQTAKSLVYLWEDIRDMRAQQQVASQPISVKPPV